MAPVSDSVINKVRALLGKTVARGATKEEAESAIRKAQEIMTKHGIEMASLGEEDTKVKHDIASDTVNHGRPQYDYDTFVMRILKECFGVNIVYSTSMGRKPNGKYGKTILYTFIGEKDEVAMAKEAAPIFVQAMKDGLKYYLNMRGLTWNSADANGFYRGVADGYIKASEEGKLRAYEQVTKEQKDRYAIVLVDKADAIALKTQEIFPQLRKVNPRRSHSSQAYGAGVQHGQGISTRRKLD